MTRSSRRNLRPRLAVCCSGHGSNLQAILDAARRGALPATVALVLSDQPTAYALTRARRCRVPTAVVERRWFPTRQTFERALLQLLRLHRIDYIALAGFMRILSPAFVRRYRGRMLNVHPALLPAFPGAHAVRDCLRYGAAVTGVTVHLVDEGVDTGPVVAQAAIAIRPHETDASLLQRLHRVEHRLYPATLRLLVSGRLRVRGRRVVHRRR